MSASVSPALMHRSLSASICLCLSTTTTTNKQTSNLSKAHLSRDFVILACVVLTQYSSVINGQTARQTTLGLDLLVHHIRPGLQ